jgi:hypothetical protein
MVYYIVPDMKGMQCDLRRAGQAEQRGWTPAVCGMGSVHPGGHYGSRMELALRYLPNAMVAWGEQMVTFPTRELTAVALRTRPVNQEGPWRCGPGP